MSAHERSGEGPVRFTGDPSSDPAFLAALSASPTACLLVDRSGAIRFANIRAEALLGYAPGTLLGRGVDDLVPIEERTAHRGHRDAYERRPEDRPMATGRILKAVRRDGSRLDVEVGLSPIETEVGSFVVAALVDRTEARVLAQMKDDLISTVSHELRTPATSIQGAVELMLGGVAGVPSSEMRELLEMAARNCRRLGLILDDLLDVQIIDAGVLEIAAEWVDVGALIAEAEEAVRDRAHGRGVRVRSSAIGQPTAVRGSRRRIAQVLVSLLDNAISHSPADGTVWIEFRPTSEGLRISVGDEGPGVPAHAQNRIFGKFERVDSTDRREHGGAGLGLYIARSIAEAHGGSLTVESVPGAGARFHLDLPVGGR